jgi:aryl carrier-like protein
MKQLATSFSTVTQVASSSNAPLTQMEQQLQVLWSNTFGTDPVTFYAEDSFFSLGGDSVLAIKLVAEACAIGLDLTLETIFRHPVLSDMASVTEQLKICEEEMNKKDHNCILDSVD